GGPDGPAGSSGPRSPAAAPAWADGSPGRFPSAETMQVQNRSARLVAEGEHQGRTYRGDEPDGQCGEDHVSGAGRRRLWLARTIQPYPYRGAGWRVGDGGGGRCGQGAGPP